MHAEQRGSESERTAFREPKRAATRALASPTEQLAAVSEQHPAEQTSQNEVAPGEEDEKVITPFRWPAALDGNDISVIGKECSLQCGDAL